MSPSLDKVTCPTCKTPNTYRQDNPFRPFCSSRCKLIDLGDWAEEKHRVAGDETPAKDDDENG